MGGTLVGGAVLSAFLQVAFDRLASREVLDYLNKRKVIDRLVQKLKMELLSADVVLIDAEEKQITNPAVKEWLDELKDVVYDADDLLDEIATEALLCKSEEEVESQTRTIQVWDFFSTPLNSFDKWILSELETVLDKLKCITKLKNFLGLKEVIGGLPSRQLTTSCPEEYGVYGRDVDKEKIFKSLQLDDASGNGICVVPIVGMGGVGKTTLARLVYNDNKVKEKFDLKAWVCVSDKFDSFRIAKTILEEVTLSTCDIQNLNLLQIRIRETLTRQRFFLVLDDVWNENYNDWDELLRVLRCGAQEIKIIITTRSEKVASIVHTLPIHYLEQLSEEECWLLFAKHAFRNGNSYTYPDLEVIGRGIVKKCNGLPLAAKVLGGLLRSKEKREWNKILKSYIWDLPEGKNDILPSLRLSYHYLPSHLKRCFVYCSIMPKNYEFEKEELVLLWMAEDLLRPYKENGRMEEIGEQYFDDLVSRSLFQRSNNHKSRFVMHDLVNDLAKFISGEFFFRLEIDKSSDITRKTRHLSYFITEFDTSKKFEVCYEAKGLRTFLRLERSSFWWFKYKNIATMTMGDFLETFKCLRVLSLSSYNNIKELPDSVSNLIHVRYLNLSNTSIKVLPDSICTLFNLQTLLLRGCLFLEKLPTNMRRLVNLRHLDITGTNLKEMPSQMGKLRNLQTLSTFVVGKDNGSSINELEKLQHLSKKLFILNLQNVDCARDATKFILKDKWYLFELELRWGDDTKDSENERNVLERLCPPANLKSLTIEHYGGTRFPNWLGDCSFSNMVSLELYSCKYCFFLPSLGQLPGLKELSIVGFDGVSCVDHEFYGNGGSAINSFRSLEILSFQDMPEWEEWFLFEGQDQDECGVFSTLRKLRMIGCPKLSKGLPNYLPSLNELEIRECQQLVASLPRAPALHVLHLRDCDKVLLKESPPTLQRLTIEGRDILQSFVELMTFLPGGCLPITLKSLEIHGILQLPRGHYYPSLESLEIHGGCDSLWSFSLEFFPKVKFMYMYGCENLESLTASEGFDTDLASLTRLRIMDCPKFISFPSKGLWAPNLTEIVVFNCKNLKSMPKGMHTLLPSLVALQLEWCPELESFPEGGLPRNLKTLHISKCDKLFSRRVEWGLQDLHSLREFRVGSKCEEVESFPEEALLPPTLATFSISYFPNLKSLNSKGFQHLTFLQRLEINFCEKLQYLPEEGLPSSLSSLVIWGCLLLQQRCQREKGVDWSKIAHIPYIDINGDIIP